MFAVAVVLAGAALAGCSATPPVDATSAPVEASASASPEPAAEPAPATSDPTCDTVLTEEAIARLEADGLEQIDVGASTFYPIADDLIEAGGLACKWGRPSSDATLTVVQLSGIDVASSEWPAALAAAGYAETGDPVPGAHSGPTDPGTGVPSVVVVETDRLTFVSTPLHAIDVAVD
ncbi:hypothetical protein ASE68_00200 [Agromyces sp. Leaf222]|nr:hypothetical protein ASE68_00200 [Agromyces sp. Leaf222]